MLFRNIFLPQSQLIAGQEKNRRSARQMERFSAHPQEERGFGLTAGVHETLSFNLWILAEQIIHFNARNATKTYNF
jgi:hypothetical protein